MKNIVFCISRDEIKNLTVVL